MIMWQHHIPQNIFFRKLELWLNLSLADSRILCFWQVPKSIHKCIIKLHVLQCLFVRGSNKKQKKGRIISNFSPYLSQSSDNIAMWSPYLHPSKKSLSFPFSLGKKKYIWKLNWKESLLIYFENFQGAPCSHRQSRNRMMNTFIIVNIALICR